MINMQDIKGFYENKNIAIIGASRAKNKYGNMLMRELTSKGYNVLPVNPNAEEINGLKCFKKVADLPPEIKVAIVVVPPKEQDIIAEECAKFGMTAIWLHEHVMKGISNTKAIFVCEKHGIKAITGFCPIMFIPNIGFPHNAHKIIMNLFKALPQ